MGQQVHMAQSSSSLVPILTIRMGSWNVFVWKLTFKKTFSMADFWGRCVKVLILKIRFYFWENIRHVLKSTFWKYKILVLIITIPTLIGFIKRRNNQLKRCRENSGQCGCCFSMTAMSKQIHESPRVNRIKWDAWITDARFPQQHHIGFPPGFLTFS